jgi:hypothetical protein
MNKRKYIQVLQLQRVCFGEVVHDVIVKKINGRYHCRVYMNGLLNQEAVCDSKANIGYTCRSLLRWEDKCGNISKWATSARERHNEKDFD